MRHFHALVRAVAHLTQEPPSQSELENALNSSLSEEELADFIDKYYQVTAVNGIERAMREHDLDLIAAPADSSFVCLATGGGRPP